MPVLKIFVLKIKNFVLKNFVLKNNPGIWETILSSIALAADDPIISDETRVLVLWYLDLIFTSIFIFETIIKFIDLGGIFHPGSYFRSIWNILDIIVVVGAILGLVLVGEGLEHTCS